MTKKKQSIIIVDDHPVLCSGIKDILKQLPLIGKIQCVNNGESLLNLLQKETIDLVILDIGLPDMDGIELADIIKTKYKNTKILMLSSFVSPEFILQCYEIGVNAYLSKTANAEEIKRGINCVINGEQYFTSDVNTILLKRLIRKDQYHKFLQTNEELSSREIAILKLICHKKNYKQIAEILFISKNTVRKHRQNIMQKTICHNTTDLYEYALKKGIISLP